MAVTINAKGTTENSFFLGKQGPIIKNSSGVIELRNAADTDFAEFRAATPTTSDGLATKEYVDGVATGLEFKTEVIAATTAALPAGTYANVATSPSGLGATFAETGTAGPLTVDGIQLAVNDRVLVKDQASQLQNGIYTLTTLGVTSTTSWVLTRATDADNDPSTDVSGGIFTFVESGTVNADTSWVLSLPTGNASLGVDSLAFAQFSSTGTTTVSGTGSRIVVTPSGSDYAVNISTSYVGQESITTLGTIVTGTWQGSTVAVAHGGTGQTAKDSVLDSGAGRIIVTGGANSYLGGGTDLTLDVDESNLDLANIGGAVPLATKTSGILSVNNGGTGRNSLLPNGILFGNGSSPVGVTAAGTENQILRAGASGVPAFTSSISIESDGDVGIGTVSPGSKLTVADSSGLEVRVLHESNGTTVLRRDGAVSYLLSESSISSNRELVFGAQTSSGGTIVEHMRINSDGEIGIGTDSPVSTIGGVDISSGGRSLILGADENLNSRTDATAKTSRFGSAHYTNAQSPMALIVGSSTSSDNTLNIGGGSNSFNGATDIRFYAAATTTTTTGTERMRIEGSSGDVGIGNINPSRKLDVTQDSATIAAINALADSSSYTGDVLTTETNTVAGSGFNHILSTSDVDGTPDPVFRVQGDGLVFADGAYSGSGADYADYFEWEDGNPDNEDRVGQSVVLTDSGKIRMAIDGETPIGVISGRPSVAGNAAADSWSDKFIKDDYHRYIIRRGKKIVNPEYDPNAEYTPRPDRAEWDAVGLVGRLPVNKRQIKSPSWTKIRDISYEVEEWLITGSANQVQVTTYIDPVVPSNESELTEETATAKKLEELTNLYYDRLNDGFVWEKETFDIDERSQHNISTEFMFQAQSVNDFPKKFSWRGFKNQEVAMDYDQFMNFAKASREHVKKMRATKAKHEKSINRKRLVSSIMGCNISTDWPKTAEEFLTKKKKK